MDQAECKNIVQVLCHLVKGENNFTFEFLGVKVQESKKNKISKRSIVYLRTDYNCAMSRASLILKFNWSTLSAGESESDSNMKKSIVLVQRNDIEDSPPGATMAVSRPQEVQRRSWRPASNDFEWLDKFFRLSWLRQCR